MRADMDEFLGPVDAYVAQHGALNAVLFLLMCLVLLAAAAGLIRGPSRQKAPAAARPRSAPVLPSQRGLQDRPRTRTGQ